MSRGESASYVHPNSHNAVSPNGPSTGDAGGEPLSRQERVVLFRPRTVLAGLGIVLGVAAALGFVLLAQSGLTLIAVALFLALALNPAVEFFQRRGLRRGLAVAAVYGLAVVVFALLALVFIPPLVAQINHFVNALPSLVHDLTKGRGPLGFLERKYHVVEEVRKVTSKQGSSGLTGAATPALGVVKGVATTVGGLVIIAFLTLFMLLEGPEWRRRLVELIPERHRPPLERIAAGVYKSVGGFVTGNLLASFLAGVFATVLVYHAIEGHSLRPLIYGRALKLSALAVLIAILLGAEVAGILGALVAIPIAGSIQAVVSELRDQRNRRQPESAVSEAVPPRNSPLAGPVTDP